MDTQVIKVGTPRDQQRAIREAAKILAEGGLVVFPTETVYGLAARADIPEAMARLRDVKDREVQQGFTVHVAHREDAAKYVPVMPSLGNRLLRKAWPGPLTLLVDVDQPELTPIMATRNREAAGAMYYKGTVGLRCPDDAIACGILEGAGGPVVAASANLAGKPPPRTGDEALADLNGKFDLLVDSGRTKYLRASTIVKLTGHGYELVREGVLDAGVIERMAVLHLLFVCTGNTCRSPMAAALAKMLLAEKLHCSVAELPARGVRIASAGISGGSGTATSGAVKAMARRGLDLGDHSSTLMTVDALRQADHVFVMTQAHFDSVAAIAPWAREKTRMLLESEDVEDPIGSSDSEYERCAQIIEGALKQRLQEVQV